VEQGRGTSYWTNVTASVEHPHISFVSFLWAQSHGAVILAPSFRERFAGPYKVRQWQAAALQLPCQTLVDGALPIILFSSDCFPPSFVVVVKKKKVQLTENWRQRCSDEKVMPMVRRSLATSSRGNGATIASVFGGPLKSNDPCPLCLYDNRYLSFRQPANQPVRRHDYRNVRAVTDLTVHVSE
jgi:hypothetical protein